MNYISSFKTCRHFALCERRVKGISEHWGKFIRTPFNSGRGYKIRACSFPVVLFAQQIPNHILLCNKRRSQGASQKSLRLSVSFGSVFNWIFSFQSFTLFLKCKFHSRLWRPTTDTDWATLLINNSPKVVWCPLSGKYGCSAANQNQIFTWHYVHPYITV